MPGQLQKNEPFRPGKREISMRTKKRRWPRQGTDPLPSSRGRRALGINRGKPPKGGGPRHGKPIHTKDRGKDLQLDEGDILGSGRGVAGEGEERLQKQVKRRRQILGGGRGEVKILTLEVAGASICRGGLESVIHRPWKGEVDRIGRRSPVINTRPSEQANTQRECPGHRIRENLEMKLVRSGCPRLWLIARKKKQKRSGRKGTTFLGVGRGGD